MSFRIDATRGALVLILAAFVMFGFVFVYNTRQGPQEQQNAPLTTDETRHWEVLQSEAIGLEIKYPQGWRATEAKNAVRLESGTKDSWGIDIIKNLETGFEAVKEAGSLDIMFLGQNIKAARLRRTDYPSGCYDESCSIETDEFWLLAGHAINPDLHYSMISSYKKQVQNDAEMIFKLVASNLRRL